MTRDEAIDIEMRKLHKLYGHVKFNGILLGDIAKANVDALIELGVLKVSEPPKPPTVWDKLSDVVRKGGYSSRHDIGLTRYCLDKAGLELVEKKNDK